MSQVVNAVATVASIIPGPWQIPAQIYLVASNVYGQAQAKKKAAAEQAAQAAAQRAAYNASLKERTITRIAADLPATFVYGRAKVGSAIVAIFTSGDRDEYKHLVCIHAAHECDAFEEVYINGVALGTLDGDGFPSSSSSKFYGKVRVKQHLGTASDPADATLISECPTKWTSTAVLRGYCYTYIRLDLTEPEFQGNLPSVEVLLRGKKLYDPRDASTAWSQNNALVIYDYLTSDICGVDAADLPSDQFITAANVCDEAESFGSKYTFNGTVTADQDQSKILEQMAQSMAGGIVPITWDIYAGKYVAPVMALGQSDIVGAISITPGVSDASLYNGVKGQYISSETLYVGTDFKPFQNATYLAADGRDLWTNIDFPFTDGVRRVHNLARIFVEDQRNGYTVRAGFSLKAWGLKVGQRVTLTSTVFGWSSKVFRVTDKIYSPTSAVELILKEDAASIWDYADAVVADSTPNTDLPDPFLITAPSGLALSSGTSELFMAGDGTIVSRIKVAWTQPSDQLVQNGFAEIQYKTSAASDWIDAAPVQNSVGPTWIAPVKDGVAYDVRVRFNNPFTRSAWTTSTNHTVAGKSVPPADVTGFSASQNGDVVVFRWNPVDDYDAAGYEIRFVYQGGAWESGTPVTKVTRGTSITTAAVPPGRWTFHIKARDYSRNYSTNSASFDMEVTNTFDLIYQENEAPDWHGTLTGLVRHWTGVLVPQSQNLASADGWETFDQLVPNPVAVCEYEHPEVSLGFDATVRIWNNIDARIPPTGSGAAEVSPQIDYRTGAGSYDGYEHWTVGQVIARDIKMKLVVDTSLGTPVLHGFTPTLDAQELRQAFTAVIAAGGSAITWPTRYHNPPSVGATVQGTTGLIPVIDPATITATGATAHVFNTSNADVGGTITVDVTGA